MDWLDLLVDLVAGAVEGLLDALPWPGRRRKREKEER